MPHRVSTNQVYKQAYESVSDARSRHAESAEKVSSQKNIVRPSDDPQGWRLAREMKDDATLRETLIRNGHVAMNFLQATETMIGQASEKLTRGYELAIIGIDRINDEAQTHGALAELRELRESLLQTLNMKYGGRTLLGGMRSDSIAFDEQGRFLGDANAIRVELEPGRYYSVNITGSEAVKGEGIGGGVDIIRAFDTVIEGLERKDHKMTGESLDIFLKGIDQMSMVRATIGARMAGIDTALANNESNRIDLVDLASRLEDIDVAKVFSEMARDQTALSASIQTAEKMIHESPADILFR